MKKLFKTLLATTMTATLLLSTACGNSSATDTKSSTAIENATEAEVVLVVGATSIPHAEMLKYIKEDLLAENVVLEVKDMSDYKLINPSTFDGSLDANFFQHEPFLDSWNVEAKGDLVSVGPVHIEPIGAYSKSLTDIKDLKEGDKISVPNDESNETRALLLLQKAGIIEVDSTKANLTPLDITSNPLSLEFIELEGPLLPRSADEVAIAVINTNYALEGGFNPINDALVREDSDSPYSNILVVKSGRENEEAIQKLYKALTSEKMKTFLIENPDYNGAIVPAF